MTREDFKIVVKKFSLWKIDKRIGDYKLPNGEYLHKYVEKLVEHLLQTNGIALHPNGSIKTALWYSNGNIDFIVDQEIIRLEKELYLIDNFVTELIIK